ncbi:protein phosphatase CheZ [Wenzhouxiangella sp. AB-CW3]|uniref:protein phosphatase CheZ n=1 Tax=Wenzhouxiangella sp. AB-CW3 TaxID=2771012 RepID=UPI00168BD6BB|nr:protein phosphatase CheZ [Wenzhouxiangella sp. AB-CW3]QOC21186.1 protein phosphatase CheZ [Wenzhouxiangella sp. AB-CW3]
MNDADSVRIAEAGKPQDYLETIETLASAARAGDEATFYANLDELTALRERSLFQDIGRLTRQLHEALTNFQVDPRVEALAKEEFPDARHRLDQVVAMTEESAHKTMDLVEESLPLTESLAESCESLDGQWRRFRRREMSAAEFNELIRTTQAFFEQTRADSGQLRGNLSEVLLAQNFQDLSGQTIRKVVRLVQEVETTLIDMIRLSGQVSDKVSEAGQAAEASAPKRKKKAEELKNQDEVDDLLSSLGF